MGTSAGSNDEEGASMTRDAATSEQFSVLSGAWIMSCNDQNPIMTYRGISDRLNLAEGFDVKALIDSRRELFRSGVPDFQLDPWKAKLREGVNVPNWIRQISDDNERKKAIDSLSRHDVFRNQFRITKTDPCDLATIEWGLEHIERLRNSKVEERQQRIQLVSLLVIPVLSLVTAIVSLLGTAYVQFNINRAQTELKQYELGFKPKQEAYTAFMSSLLAVYDAATTADGGKLVSATSRMESVYFTFEPFLSPTANEELWRKLQEFFAFCRNDLAQATRAATAGGSAAVETATESAKNFVAFRNYFRSRLFTALFSGGPVGTPPSK
jgi:hypothetical protein